VRDRRAPYKADIDRLGLVETLSVREVNAMGGDPYEVTLAKGRAQVALLMEADGQIFGIGYRPL